MSTKNLFIQDVYLVCVHKFLMYNMYNKFVVYGIYYPLISKYLFQLFDIISIFIFTHAVDVYEIICFSSIGNEDSHKGTFQSLVPTGTVLY